MAYDKHTWTCHEPITADKLNHMEEGIANAGGDCDCGFECEDVTTTLTEESVTTVDHKGVGVGEISYSQLIDAETIIVTFNGTTYECPRVDFNGGYLYGASWNQSTGSFDWSEYPFNIYSNSDLAPVNGLSTETAGTYSIKVESVSIDVTTSPCFCAAVNKCVQGNGKLIEIIGSGTCPDNQTTYHEYNITWDEILQGIHDGVTFWLVDAVSGTYYQIITFDLKNASVSDYTVRAYRYDEQSITPLTLYSDTTDGRLRDVRCRIA